MTDAQTRIIEFRTSGGVQAKFDAETEAIRQLYDDYQAALAGRPEFTAPHLTADQLDSLTRLGHMVGRLSDLGRAMAAAFQVEWAQPAGVAVPTEGTLVCRPRGPTPTAPPPHSPPAPAAPSPPPGPPGPSDPSPPTPAAGESAVVSETIPEPAAPPSTGNTAPPGGTRGRAVDRAFVKRQE